MTASPLSAETVEPRAPLHPTPEHPQHAVEASPVRHGAQLGLARVLLSPAAEELCRTSVGTQQMTRCAVTEASVARQTTPVIDDDGLLWWCGAWVAIPDAQLPLARALVARFQRSVPDSTLASAYRSRTGSTSSIVVGAALRRLGDRVVGCGLTLRRIRGRGYILDGAFGPVR
jgi:hypothetical protein